MVALVSVVRTTPSLQTTPIVVVKSKCLSFVILGFPTCRVSSYFLRSWLSEKRKDLIMNRFLIA